MKYVDFDETYCLKLKLLGFDIEINKNDGYFALPVISKIKVTIKDSESNSSIVMTTEELYNYIISDNADYIINIRLSFSPINNDSIEGYQLGTFSSIVSDVMLYWKAKMKSRICSDTYSLAYNSTVHYGLNNISYQIKPYSFSSFYIFYISKSGKCLLFFTHHINGDTMQYEVGCLKQGVLYGQEHVITTDKNIWEYLKNYLSNLIEIYNID